MTTTTEKYYVPESSPWPLTASFGLFFMAVGGANFIQQVTNASKDGTWYGAPLFFFGVAWLVVIVTLWWRDAIKESINGLHSKQLDGSYRQGMLWFIFSEVTFFAALFGALFYTRWLILPWLGGEGVGAMTHEMLWPEFQAIWPLTVTPDGTTSAVMGAWGLPAINTAILVASSLTLSVAHHALLEDNRPKVVLYQAITVLLGAIFLSLQMYEYVYAYEIGLTFDAGIYGSLFFMLTGFHGIHVTIGTLFLLITLIRYAKGHFNSENNFAWEAGAWYWHFVDVVWLFLFVVVYWL